MYNGNMKTCSMCNETKQVSDFHKRAGSPDGLRRDCKACVCARVKSRRDANLEQERARESAYQVAHRAEKAAASSAWRKANPAGVADQVARHRARKLAATVEDVQYATVLATHGRWCYLCESPVREGEELHMDHVEPLAHGGAHSYANVRPSHGYCNRSKNDRQLHELDLPFAPPHLLVVI